MAQSRRKTTMAVASVSEPEIKMASESVKLVETKKKFEPNEPVLCRSVCQGALFMEGQSTKIMYRFDDYGSEVGIEYRDLVSEVRSNNSSFIYNPMFIVVDEDFIKEFPALQKFYEKHYSVTDLRGILELSPEEMIEEMKALPKGAAEQLKLIASAMVSDGTLDSMRKIKALEEFYGVDMSIIANVVES